MSLASGSGKEQRRSPEVVSASSKPKLPARRGVMTDQKAIKITSVSSLQSPSLTEESKKKKSRTRASREQQNSSHAHGPPIEMENSTESEANDKTQEFHYSGSFGIPETMEHSMSPRSPKNTK